MSEARKAARAAAKAPTGVTDELNAAIREEFGVEVVGIRLSAAGHMLDFRYKIFDAEKAASLHGPKVKPVLIDIETGFEFKVPRPPKLGPLKSTRYPAKANRTYTVIFANMGKAIQPGRAVAVKLGGLKVDRIVVQ
ncbi:MAG: hypothetical protein GY910_05690 [bacterium]|nr:hypothetical protein [bacterium]